MEISNYLSTLEGQVAQVVLTMHHYFSKVIAHPQDNLLNYYVLALSISASLPFLTPFESLTALILPKP